MSFSVTIVNLLGAPTYQWYFNNNAIPGATGTSLTLQNVSVQNIGSYFIAVNAGIWGVVDSGTATLTVYDSPPTVYNQAYSGRQNTFLTVAPPGVLTNDKAAYAGPLTALLATNVSHGTLNLNTNGGFTYMPAANYYGSDSFYYIASDGMSNSAPALVSLTILAPPAITTQPQSQQVVSNRTATFSVTASGTTPLSYQWYFQGSLLSGATDSTLTISNATSMNAGIYAVVVTNVAGSVTSTPAALTVISPPTVSAVGASSVTTNSALLNAAVNPNGATASYYFQYGLTTNYNFFTGTNVQAAGALVVGTDDVTAAVTGLTPGTVYHYTVVAANAAGTSVGPDATFQTAYLPPQLTTVDATNVTAGSARLRARINPEGTAAKCFFQFGVTTNYGAFTKTNDLAAGTNDVTFGMTISNLAPGTVYYYSVVAINSGGTSMGADVKFSTLSILPIQLNGAMITQGNAGQKYMQLTFTNVPGASFTVLGATNLIAPPTDWTVLGSMTETASGQYQFTDPQSATNPSCYYRIQSN